MPFVARGAKRRGVEAVRAVCVADAAELGAQPDFLQRLLTDATDGVFPVHVLVTQGDPAVGQHQTT